MFIAAHVGGVLVRGFSTLIAKAFVRTGRLTDYGVRRLRQNNRQMLEICMPGGLDRHGDGWKLTVRIRLVHAQMRRRLKESGEWDEAVWGTPLSAAHIGFGGAAFSALLRWTNPAWCIARPTIWTPIWPRPGKAGRPGFPPSRNPRPYIATGIPCYDGTGSGAAPVGATSGKAHRVAAAG